MKQILSYNSEYDDICVIKAVSEAEAPDAFRAYVKERAVELLEIEDNEAEELMEDNCDMEYGLCYYKETHAASIFLTNRKYRYLTGHIMKNRMRCVRQTSSRSSLRMPA